MSKHHIITKECHFAKIQDRCISIGNLPEDAQVTIKDTEWSEEEKERMRQAGYDGVDMVRAWYS